MRRLTDFEDHEDAVERLLEVMHQEAKAPSAEILGAVGETPFRACFEAWYGVKRWWYRKVAGDVRGIPFIVEAAVAETIQPGSALDRRQFFAHLRGPAGLHLLAGAKGVGLRPAKLPEERPHRYRFPTLGLRRRPRRRSRVHLVCPVLEFLDRGKTRLKVPPPWRRTSRRRSGRWSRTCFQEEERRRTDAARAERSARERERQRTETRTWTLKDAVFEVLREAWQHATGHDQYPVSSRFLFYPVRKLIQRWTSKDLDYDYFSPDLLIEYQRQHGPLRGLYYDPRGVLYEAHSGKAIPLGTREVDAYQFPAWLYEKILYVEKKGVWPILQAAALAERYDMAVIAAEGYATEATRVLFAQADKGQHYQLFVLHDADPDGYNIARTLREETRRMPGYAVEIIDLGLKLEEALDMDLGEEEWTRRKALPQELVLTGTERAYFEGRRAGHKS